MIHTVIAAGDLLTAVPTFWSDARWPLGIVVCLIGAVVGATKITHGIAKAAGIMIGGLALSAIVLAGPNIAMAIKHTIDNHTGGVSLTRYGQ